MQPYMPVVAPAIFVATLLAILTRPRGLGEGVAALIGGALMVATAVVPVPAALGVLAANWDVFLFFLGMLTVTALAEQAGIFSWLAAWAARLSCGSRRRLFLNVFILGILISTFLTNDATALILSPLVYSTVRLLELDPLPYMFACTFIADTASLTLPVSNPINILVGEHFGLTAAGFLRYLLLPSLAAIAMNVAVFLVLFRRRISGRFDTALLREREASPSHPFFFTYSAVLLLLLAVAFVAGGITGVPAGLIALVGAALLLGGAAALRAVDARRFAHDFSWGIFPFIAGLFVVVRGVERVGLSASIGHVLHSAPGNPLASALLSTGVSAAGTNLINNVPTALVMVSAIGPAHGAVGYALVYGTLLGCDLGPNLTTTGSLSTMLWLLLLRQRGLEISSLQYLRLGVIVTPLMLLATALILGATV
jgi:arsenical pump membrane protein